MLTRFALSGCAAMSLCAGAAAQMLEDFEHGNENLWEFAGTTVDTMDLTAAAARGGSFGAQFGVGTNPAFRTRFDLTTAPGNEYQAFVRSRTENSGRIYLGVGASPGGTWSAIFAPNTSQILLQNNSGWGFVSVQTAPFTPTPGTWYILRLNWATDGAMTVSIWDEAGTSQLAQTSPALTGLTTPGGVALRGFTIGTGNFNDLDEISVVGGACYANCDGSTNQPILNVADFTCFLTKFAAQDPYANCDGSTTEPILNVADFTCFLSKFAAGC
jgi:hypothetical protein